MGRRESVAVELLCILEAEPGLSQRELASRIGISLGHVNHCLKALIAKGAIRLVWPERRMGRRRPAYVVTPVGLAERDTAAARLLEHMRAEAERLRRQIDAFEQRGAPRGRGG